MRVAIALGCVVACCATARAQFVSVYGTFQPTHASNVVTGSVYNGGTYTQRTTDFWAPAFGGGVTVNFLNLHVVKLGLDARGGTKSGTTGLDTAQVSLRLGIQPPLLRLKPYIQGGVGYLQTRTTNVSTTSSSNTPLGGTYTNSYATYGLQGGIDKPIFPFIDFRMVEIGFTRGFSERSNANTFTISTGLVAHF